MQKVIKALLVEEGIAVKIITLILIDVFYCLHQTSFCKNYQKTKLIRYLFSQYYLPQALTIKTTKFNHYQPVQPSKKQQQASCIHLLHFQKGQLKQSKYIYSPQEGQWQKDLPKISEIIAGDTLLLFLHLHYHTLLHCRILHLHLLMLHLHSTANPRLLHAAAYMPNNSGYIRVVFHHLLMVAATLVGRSSLNPQTHQHVDLEQPAIAVTAFEEPVVRLQEVHVGCVLSDAPEGVVVVAVQVDPRWTLTEPTRTMLISSLQLVQPTVGGAFFLHLHAHLMPLHALLLFKTLHDYYQNTVMDRISRESNDFCLGRADGSGSKRVCLSDDFMLIRM